MELLIEALIGFVAGVLGGLLGLGGSVVIIPALIFYLSQTGGYTGEKQHLLQAAAMICNVFIAAPSTWVHWRAGAILRPVLVVLIPTALLGSLMGVAVSNSFVFARRNGPYLAMLLAGFFVFVAVYNVIRAMSQRDLTAEFDEDRTYSVWRTALCGLPMGFFAGLLGIGGGTIAVPMQQIFLRVPLRRAIANSAVTILFAATLGAIYKNASLHEHGESFVASLRLAAMIVPTAILGGYIGGKLTHRISRKALRVIFVVFMIAIAVLTFQKARQALESEARRRESESNTEVVASVSMLSERSDSHGNVDGCSPRHRGGGKESGRNRPADEHRRG
ncbi:MAG: sulfite exporter TauE/SafE family protein [Pirellulaceae bacterium]|nr:sulfite exporter TauE/SafE family protein [Pirellulaceae bacterium]